ncbi:MAG: hypothetical protein KZQ77_13100 [Candidatus Thiodiazotropha sp. (ex Notomyrtea botanica)]|nr:hypothetical protein [Candidatus Thiodiazotropha sp. (ex Notomyrtea botanica)]
MKRLILILILAVSPLSSLADNTRLIDTVRLGLAVLDFEYEEFDDRGPSLDWEDGLLPGLDAGAAIVREQWRFDASLLWLSGVVDYGSPAEDSKTDTDILNLELTAGYGFYTTERQNLSLIAGAGYRKWWRNIRSTPTANGLDEIYDWGYGLLGLRGKHRLDQQTHLTGEFYLTRVVNPGLNVRFISHFDNAELDLGEETGFRIRLTLDRQLSRSTSFWVSPWYEYWELGRSNDAPLFSNGIQVGTLFEPQSETRNFGVNLGLSWRFGAEH